MSIKPEIEFMCQITHKLNEAFHLQLQILEEYRNSSTVKNDRYHFKTIGTLKRINLIVLIKSTKNLLSAFKICVDGLRLIKKTSQSATTRKP